VQLFHTKAVQFRIDPSKNFEAEIIAATATVFNTSPIYGNVKGVTNYDSITYPGFE